VVRSSDGLREMSRRFAIVLLVSLVLSLTSTNVASAASTPPANLNLPLEYATSMPAIQVAVVHDGLDANGRWSQVVRLTIEGGGTLADASMIVYGDTIHVDQIFAAARQKNPTLTAPAMIPAGQQIDLDIDPSTTYVLQNVLTTPDTVVQRFTNGVVSTLYLHPNDSLQQVIAFPNGKPTDLFVYPGSNDPIKARPGGRIVDLVYRTGDSFGAVVNSAYGLTTFAAAQDFTNQTGWEPIHWPPSSGQEKVIVVGPRALFTGVPSAVSLLPNPDPVGRARQLQLAAERQRIGVIPVRRESFGTVYHVAVNDPSVTASQLSQMIYGTPAHRDDLARAAGFAVPSGNTGVKAFDPHLFGRSFDLTVDYVDENFVVARRTDGGATTVELADGALTTTYAAALSGPMEVVDYPTGYKRILYRPPKAYLTIAQGMALFSVAQDLTLSPSAATQLTTQYIAGALWRISPGIPKAPGDVADSIQLIDSPQGTYLVALVAPPGPHTPVDTLLSLIDVRNPIEGIVALVIGSVVLVILVDLAGRRVRRPRRVRW